MSIFNPELKEEREGFFEAKHFSSDFEKRLLRALDRKRETFPDIVLCPNKSCGWEQTLTRDPSARPSDGLGRDDTD
ncbi:hypothetical protein HY733_02745 [Candidatus Uhrbacteria bacterium]|nr:hypothetical protein [Candidatus Uhrbacteria bacterium]